MPSTVIRSFYYDASRAELLVVFRSGRRYLYKGVPEHEVLRMRAAYSKGNYFNDHIRSRYEFERDTREWLPGED